MLDRAKTFDANTHELAAEYRGAVRATLPAGISAADEEAFWRALTDTVAGDFAMVERRQRRPAKGELERWQRIGDLVDELGKELRRSAGKRAGTRPTRCYRTGHWRRWRRSRVRPRAMSPAMRQSTKHRARDATSLSISFTARSLIYGVASASRFAMDGRPANRLVRWSASSLPVLATYSAMICQRRAVLPTSSSANESASTRSTASKSSASESSAPESADRYSSLGFEK